MTTLTQEQRETLVTEAKMFTASVGSYRIEQLIDHLAPFIEEILDGDKALCDCGHAPIDHHGIDPDEGCLGIVSHKLPPCPCRLTCGEAGTAASAGNPGWLHAEFERATARASLVPPLARPRLTSAREDRDR